MADSIPALIAKADDYAQRGWGDISEFAARVSKALKRRAKRADALESLSALSGDNREAAYQAVRDSGSITGDVYSNARVWKAVEAALNASRRPSPVTRENPVVSAIEDAKAEVAAGRRASVVVDIPDPVTREEVIDFFRSLVDGDEWLGSTDVTEAADEFLSRFSLPEPAEDEWEYGVEDNIAEGGIDEGYSSEERALSVAAYRTGQYVTPGTRAWAVKRRPAGDWVPVKGAK